MNTKELAVCSVFLFVGTVQGFSGGSSLSIYQTTHRFPSTCTTTGTHSATAVAAAASKDDDGTTTSDADNDVAMEKAIKAMTAFTNKYLENTNTKLCSDKSVASVVIKGLAEHKLAYSSPLCPCRFYEDKQAEAKDGYWNCPCVPMRERHECHCMLFLTEDNPFAGDETHISVDEVLEATSSVEDM